MASFAKFARFPPQPASAPAGVGRPHLLPRPRLRYSVLALWHLLSLDAPCVAAVWTLFLAHAAGVSLPWASPAAMFVAVWMIYAADRLLDARALDPGNPTADLEERHRFHHRHRSALLAGILAAAPLLCWLLWRIDPRALQRYMLLAVLLGAWLLLIHARSLTHSPIPGPIPGPVQASAQRPVRRLPKELAVGLFFPAAVLIPTAARAPATQLPLVPSALLLASTCTLNCLLIYAWEHRPPWRRAHRTTRWALAHLRPLTAVLFLAALIDGGLCLSSRLPAVGQAPALACALSVTALFALDTFRARLSALHLRAAADLALLTPLLFLLHVLPTR